MKSLLMTENKFFEMLDTLMCTGVKFKSHYVDKEHIMVEFLN